MHLPRITRGAGLLLVLTLIFVALSSLKLVPATGQLGAVFAAQPPAVLGTQPSQVRGNPEVHVANKSDVSVPLASIPPRLNPSILPPESGPENPTLGRNLGRAGVDSVVQRLLGPLAMPAPIQNFEGEYNEYGPVPPDTNGDVGRNHFVQIVNSGFSIYSKTGALLYGPTNNNVLFTGFGGLCEVTNAGDPVALYDSLADRWVLNWFAFTSQSGPTHQCIAVSTSPDPLGSYYRYDFTTNPAGFEDYPHMTVWPDAYYMTTNTFNNGANTAGNFAFDRAKMLRGDPTAADVIFRLQGDGGMLPTNFEGSTLPPAGSPNYFYEPYNLNPGQLAEFKFHVDFTTPANSTFTGPFVIGVANYDDIICGASRERCIPQPGTTALLEALDDRLMYRVEYRNFGSYESIVLNHTVNGGAPSPNGRAAPRWYELRSPNTTPTVFQQGTYAPADGLHRWVGSIAQDSAGDIAMGFSVSSSTLFPTIRYAGRRPTDPLGTFGQGEATLLAGTGSEDFPGAPRWGDYSSISIDPADDCTFWFTNEYFSQTGLRDWRTRIGSFKFPGCSASGTPTPVASPTGNTPTATAVVATATPCAGAVTYAGAIANTDPTQAGRLGLGDPKSSCAVPKAVAAVSDTLTRHYRTYTYTNSTANAQCVTVSVTQNCGNNAIQSVAYLGSYDPNNISTNYLADGGGSGHSFSYSFSLGAGQTAVVAVVEVSPNLGCAAYTLSINPCGPPTSTSTATVTRTALPTNTMVPPTNTVVAATNTPGPPTVTSTPCGIAFSDVNTANYFYIPVQYLYCHGVISGYADNTFRPYANTTRSQMVKIVVLGFNKPIQTPSGGGFTFTDVPPANPFFSVIETAAALNIVSGYNCGGPGEPCDANNRPYFRPFANVTRGQLSKIDVAAANWLLQNPATRTFEDVLPNTAFYPFVETAAAHGVISGYTCGGPGEPCGSGNRPYFRQNNEATRGQIAKIVYLSIVNGLNGNATGPAPTK